ncbi:hypothetical protein ACVMIH_004967 [Bradyrhizobium sp. USDA 4503]
MSKSVFPGFGGSQSKMQSAGRAKSGGGVGMNKNRNVGIKTGKPAQGVSPASAAMTGIQRITTRGPEKVPGPISVPLGNQLTKGTTGPGGGRTVQRTGSQGRHGGSEQ